MTPHVNKNLGVSLRRQLTCQLIYAIASHELCPGEKLWSAQGLANLLSIHSNTVSAVYQDLAQRGWVESFPGRGVFVRNFSISVAQHEHQSRTQTTIELLNFTLQPPNHFLVIEPDSGLRRILVTEIEEATGCKTIGAGLDECSDPELFARSLPISLCFQEDQMRDIVPSGKVWLRVCLRSAFKLLNEFNLRSSEILLAIVSHWPIFLEFGRCILIARGLDDVALSTCDAREEGFEKRLQAYTLVITDKVTADYLPSTCSPFVFRIISDKSLNDLRSYAQIFRS